MHIFTIFVLSWPYMWLNTFLIVKTLVPPTVSNNDVYDGIFNKNLSEVDNKKNLVVICISCVCVAVFASDIPLSDCGSPIIRQLGQKHLQ